MSNRDRITVDLESDSRQIVYIMPRGYRRIGIVRQGNGDAGVLAQIEASGEYVQLNERGTRTLNQRKVMAALDEAKRPVGRPKTGYELREVFSVRLEPSLAEYIRGLGDGNLSAGVTMLAEEHRNRELEAEITFSDSQQVIRSTRTVLFLANCGDEQRRCEISFEALQDYFDAKSSEDIDLRMAFVDGAKRIYRAARKKLMETDGRCLLVGSDFAR